MKTTWNIIHKEISNPTNENNIKSLRINDHIPLWSKSTVNAAAKCDPTERQGSSIWEAVRGTLVTVCDKFNLFSAVSRLWAMVERRYVLKCAVNHGLQPRINMKICFQLQKSSKETHEMLN